MITGEGARVALAGVRDPPARLLPLRIFRLLDARAYVTNFSGMARPWETIERYVPDLRVIPVMPGTNYPACGNARPRLQRAADARALQQ